MSKTRRVVLGYFNQNSLFRKCDQLLMLYADKWYSSFQKHKPQKRFLADNRTSHQEIIFQGREIIWRRKKVSGNLKTSRIFHMETFLRLTNQFSDDWTPRIIFSKPFFYSKKPADAVTFNHIKIPCFALSLASRINQRRSCFALTSMARSWIRIYFFPVDESWHKKAPDGSTEVSSLLSSLEGIEVPLG